MIVEVGSVSVSQSRYGFSIVELLAVSTVFSILAAIIFPLFARGREVCYRAQCASNLKQLYMAFSLYADDWGGYWPCPGGKTGDRSYWSQTGNGGLQSYVKQRGVKSVWCCPLLQEWHGKYPARSYSMNSYLRDPPDWEYGGLPNCINVLCGVNLAKLTQSTKTILLFEGIPLSKELQDNAYTEDQVFNIFWTYYILRCANWTWTRGYYAKCKTESGMYRYMINPGKPWHGKFNNYLYCDGHIRARPPALYSGNLLSSYDEMYQWYVDKAHVPRQKSAASAQ